MDSGSRTIKNYETWEGTHKFFLKGKLMLGPKWWNLLITTLLVNIPNLIALSFTFVVILPINFEKIY